MTESTRYDEGTTPAVRKGEQYKNSPCPFCGERSLLISTGDLADDHYRIELYCDNGQCDVREMTVIALRTSRPQVRERADVRALHVVDNGTKAEQETLGYEFLEGGGRVSRLSSFDLEGAQRSRLAYRTRHAEITVIPED